MQAMTGPSDDRSAKLATTCANCGPRNWSSNPVATVQVPPEAARAITALSVLRDQVVRPILAGVRSPRQGRKPATWIRVSTTKLSASACKPSSSTSACY